MIKSIVASKIFPFFVILLSLISLLIALSLYQRMVLSFNYYSSRDQNKSFECGFDQFNKTYVGFCVQYMKTAFLFLLVDLEIALLLPLFIITPLYEKTFLSRLAMILLTMVALLLILLMEVTIGGLNWREDL